MLHVRGEDDLVRLARSWNRYDGVHLVSDRLDENEREVWERRLFSAYSECGCDAGAVAVMLALAALVVVTVTQTAPHTWVAGALAVAATLAAAVLGKVVGIAAARLKLRRDIRRVRARLGAPA